jgi:hypothetical protein
MGAVGISELEDELRIIHADERSLYAFLENMAVRGANLNAEVLEYVDSLKRHGLVDDRNYLNKKGLQIIDLIKQTFILKPI